MGRNVYDLLKAKKFVILIGGGVDEKLKDDFLSFFRIKTYKVFDMEKGEFPVLKKRHSPVILCTYDKKKSKQILRNAGIMYKRDYVLAEDLFGSIDLDIMRDCRKLYVYVDERKLNARWHLYSQLFIIMHHISKEEIGVLEEAVFSLLFFAENACRRKVVFSRNLDSEEIKKNDFICLNGSVEENDRLIYQEGIAKGRKIYTLDRLKRYCFASRLLRQTYFDKRQIKSECVRPYEIFYIDPRGDIWLCPCFGELRVSDLIGNSPEEAWNSTIANIMRLSLENNTYTFCDRRCKAFGGRDDGEEVLERRKNKLLKNPSMVFVSFDKVCNLRCRSCRTRLYVKNCYEKEQMILHYADMITKSGFLETCDEFVVGGDGETFMSKGYKKLLFEDASQIRKNVKIMTNGILFTPKMWEQIEGKYESISLSISVDAVTESTYKKVRGGNFKQLMKNMEFLSELRKENKVSYVEVKMVVQEDNYREMKDFIKWTKRLGFDKADFSPIWNWGTYTNAEFRRRSVYLDKEERKMKAKFKKYVQDEVFSDPIVSTRWSRE